MTPAALALIRRILDGGLAGALVEPGGPAVAEVAALATRSMEQHLERRLRSIHLLEHG
jgi:hypothetical protein